MRRAVVPQMNGLLKTHKDDQLSIRPVINSINGPAYKLTFLLYSMLRPLEAKLKYCITNSESLISTIENKDAVTLTNFSYPFSLDIKDMYTNIPCLEASTMAIDLAKNNDLDFLGFTETDIMTLLKIVTDNNFFSFNGSMYKQVTGLPMGSRISGLLANIFVDHLERLLVPSLPLTIYNRYVDDVFILTKNENSAESIARSFNDNVFGLIFEIEKPINNSLRLLDFEVTIINGRSQISFYQKSSRSNVFVNFKSHLPMRQKRNFILNEWNRICRRCATPNKIKKARDAYIEKMVLNGYPSNLIKKWTNTPNFGSYQRNKDTQGIFYLSVPYVNDGVNRLIRKSLAPLGLNIRVSHKSQKLLSWIKPNFKKLRKSCILANCRLKNNDCLKNMVIYECMCECGASYIGSTERPLHVRIKEHHSLHISAILQHKLICNRQWVTRILANGKDVTDLRLKEAILINSKQPSLNRKEEVSPFHLVV
jgi:hypothetical protein